MSEKKEKTHCVLLAGGAGYIGSHLAVALLNADYEVLIADDFRNSSRGVIDRVEEITGKQVPCYEVDITNREKLETIFRTHRIDCVVHLAGLKAVGESTAHPLAYYRNNIVTTLALLECMEQTGCHRIVFSSSATVYGEDNPIPYMETMGRGKCSSPYGWTKVMMEQVLEDAAAANENLSVILLRYFNPIGAHESGKIGEDPLGIPNNLMPYITQVAVGQRDKLTVFGDDYDTADGTCRRDYIHIMDLAEGHVKAIEYAENSRGTEVFNLGTGSPFSVLEVVRTFEEESGVPVPFSIGERRPGDLPEFWANADKAKQILGWSATRDLRSMCRDAWRWQKYHEKTIKFGK